MNEVSKTTSILAQKIYQINDQKQSYLQFKGGSPLYHLGNAFFPISI